MNRYKDKERRKKYLRDWMRARRNEWLAENGPCVVCDTWENLEVDHRDPLTKEIPVYQLWSMAKDNPRRVAELAKCQVFCALHHQDKTNSDRNSISRDQYWNNSGENHYAAKLTESDVEEIHHIYLYDHLTMVEIGKRYMVSRATISDALNGRTWKSIYMRLNGGNNED